MRKLIYPLLLAIGLATRVGAVCTITTGVLPLEIPNLNDGGKVWGPCIQRNFEKLSIGGGGHFIEKDGVPIVQRASMNFVGASLSVFDLNGKTNIEVIGVTGDVLRSSTTYIAETTPVTTTSVDWQTVEGSTVSLFSELSTFIEMDFSCNLECTNNTSCGVNFGMLIDGELVDDITSDPNTGFLFLTTDGTRKSTPEQLQLKYRTKSKVDISTHTIALLWASPDGVEIKMGRNTSGCMVKYSNDLNLINSGAAANASGINEFGAQDGIGLQALSCPQLPCRAQNIDDFDLYTATGTLPGQWRNTRTGIGP